MVTEILWGDGTSDKIYLTYTAASGSQTIMVSSDANAGPARTKDITFVSTVGNIARVLTVMQETNMDYVSITWNDTCITYDDTAISYPYAEEYIVFVDSEVESICVSNWGDGTGIKPSQAAQVTTLNGVFKNNTDISSFDELKYFTGLTTLNQQFSGSTLTKVTLPEGIEITNSNNYKQIFYNCTYLEDVDLSDCTRTGTGVSAQTQMFNNCSALTKVRFQSVEQINDFARTAYSVTDVPFGYNTDTHYVYVNGEELKNLVIPSTITAINPGAFYRFNRLTSVTIPSTVTSIGNNAFSQCASLAGTVTIPSSVTSIGGSAFYGCLSIVNMTIESTATIASNISGTSGTTCLGDGTGIFHHHGSMTNNSNFMLNFRKIIIDGDFSNTANYYMRFLVVNRTGTFEVMKIGGNYSAAGTSALNCRPIAGSTNPNAAGQKYSFLEIMGAITSGYCILGLDNATSLNDGFILHLGYDTMTNNALPCTPEIAGASFTRLAKIYVGKGLSAAEDNAILAKYLADTNWSAYSSKLDTWYNYVNDPNANSDYIN